MKKKIGGPCKAIKEQKTENLIIKTWKKYHATENYLLQDSNKFLENNLETYRQ